MKSTNSFSKTILLLLFILWNLAVNAQTGGKIAGSVTDKKTGEALIGVSVLVKGINKGIATDVDGKYLIGGLAAGRYTLSVSYVGYATKEVSDIEVNGNSATTLNVVLEEAGSNQLSDVVVRANFKQESVNALLAQQKNSPIISSGISAEIIQRSPDKNTSEVLKRVSGASIQNNKFVVIRGLADRYNVTMLNNAIMPSTEPDKKAFSFDIIPSNLVDKILINKTASADLPADFAGGIVQVVTKDVPDQDYIAFSTSWGYNTQSTFKDFISNERGNLAYLGFGQSDRKLPGSFPPSFQKYNPLMPDQKVALTKQLSNPYGEQTYVALPTQSHQLTWGNRTDLKNGGSLGSIVSLSYRNGQNINPVERNDYQNNFQDIYYAYNDKQFVFNTSVGLLANITYKKDKTKLSFKNLLNNVYDEIYTDRTGFNTNIDGNLRFNNNELTQKFISNHQLEGEHAFGARDQKLNWNLSYSLTKRDQPDLRSIYYRENGAGTNVFSVVDRNSRRFFSDMQENNFLGQANYTLPFTLKGKKSSFKAGVLSNYKTREFNARIFNYLFNSTGSPSFDDQILTLPKDRIFASEQIRATGGFFLTDFTSNTDSYDAQTFLNAGYAMLDNRFGEKSRLVWGVRVEQYYQNVDYIDLSGTNRSMDQQFTDILPSANYTYTISDKSNFRVSASRTVSRPELRELAPFEFYDFVAQTATLGNPQLKRATINNADLRYEIYPASGESITVSAFYKDFSNAIEQVLDGSATPERRQVGFQNMSKAYSYGAELELRKRLSFISESNLFKDLTMFANLSYIKSEVEQGSANLQSRPLQGQSPYLLNGGVQYSNDKSGWSLTALYNRVGQRIAFVGNNLIPNIWENARDVVDFQISKKLISNKAELKLNVGDLLNQRSIFYLNMDDKNVYSGAVDKPYTSARFGTNVSLSFTYNFSLGQR
ncbi:TonB-dependent receptor [Pedobacter yulinensis]|uniref:TonB-dependent receptor n=1 Tax=Pedobacter yulinensis TaxID=2126353 RepID=UPI0013A66575|nr:TonB-dependent receptor [Pedobacter yulinensis]